MNPFDDLEDDDATVQRILQRTTTDVVGAGKVHENVLVGPVGVISKMWRFV